MPVIPAIPEAIKGLRPKASPGKNRRPYLEKKKKKKDWRLSSGKHLPHRCKALS
jgi:hypothetical protein